MPFETENLSLSVTLFTCGVPFPKNEEGKVIPLQNIYDGDTLRKMGYKGMEIEDAARHAHKSGRPGHLIYNFEPGERLTEVVKAWDDQCKLLANLDKIAETDEEFSKDSTDMPGISPSLVASICCQYAKNRKMFREVLWRQVRPQFVIYGKFQRQDSKDHPGFVTTGSCKLMTVDASPETRKRIGL